MDKIIEFQFAIINNCPILVGVAAAVGAAGAGLYKSRGSNLSSNSSRTKNIFPVMGGVGHLPGT